MALKSLPDPDVLVLAFTDNEVCPLFPVYHDGDCWRTANRDEFPSEVLDYIEIGQAARVLREHLGEREASNQYPEASIPQPASSINPQLSSINQA